MKGPDDVVASGEGRRVDAAAEKTARRSSHPAIHGSARGSVVPLFPRAGSRARSRDRSQLEEAQRERLESMRRHPAGKGLPPHGCARGHVVRRGDSLWSISARVLHTDDVDEVGDYWPELYSANRTVVGDDPDLICPGQVLTLPECEE